jgi:hypothetical protein
VIKSLYRRGVFLKDIASKLGVHPKTVSRALKTKSDPNAERKRPRLGGHLQAGFMIIQPRFEVLEQDLQ